MGEKGLLPRHSNFLYVCERPSINNYFWMVCSMVLCRIVLGGLKSLTVSITAFDFEAQSTFSYYDAFPKIFTEKMDKNNHHSGNSSTVRSTYYDGLDWFCA